MRLSRWLLLLFVVPWTFASLHAQDLAATCHASSSYDVTVKSDSLLFDRAAPAPLRVELRQGMLTVDGRSEPLDAGDRERLALFERELRALLPRVREVASNGVDMAVQVMQAEAGRMSPGADTRAEFEHRLEAHADALKQRIAHSSSTHDWQGDEATQLTNRIAADLLPLLASDLGQQALNAALSGDLQAAASLRDRAASVATGLQPRLQSGMQALRPQVEALCPSIRHLAGLQQGIRDSDGRELNLLRIDP